MKNFTFILIIALVGFSSCGPTEEELFSQSRTQMNGGNFEEALLLLDKLIAKNAANKAAFNMRGIAKLELGKAEEAILDFDQSVMLDSGDYRAFYNRGNAHYQLSNFDKAVADYDLALRREPRSIDLYINRANALTQLKLFDDAINDYQFALKIEKDNYLVYFNLGRTYYLMDSSTLAKKQFEKTVEFYENYAPALYFLGMIQIDNKALDEACVFLRKAADLGYLRAEQVMDLYCVED